MFWFLRLSLGSPKIPKINAISDESVYSEFHFSITIGFNFFIKVIKIDFLTAEGFFK